MIPRNCRFNPTTNGPVHLGHALIALVNEYHAHHTGGKFIVRFDDNQRFWKWRFTRVELADFESSIKDDLEWLGIQVDQWDRQSDMEAEAARLLEHLLAYHNLTLEKFLPMPLPFYYPLIADVPEYMGIGPYPYAPWLTLEKVVMDSLESIDWLIRGIDLITESSLYYYFAQMLGIPSPKHDYVGRLMADTGQIWNGNSVSKQTGGRSIGEVRQKGY